MAKWPTFGHAHRRPINVLGGSNVPNVEGTEKRKATTAMPGKEWRARNNAAVSSLLPLIRMPASAKTRSLSGLRTLLKHESNGPASTHILPCLEARCPQKSRCRTKGIPMLQAHQLVAAAALDGFQDQ
eukprot:CAMPEP_0172895564 /NCGR_PEP_ID=MMETSP1075-20121228/153371_1 /TAXON_ID=2916 /ORGANISM="Ceratium fusus, Strain PA161109" /LENGTH=127 /DNA_ID=CAMNT_0013750795 /DNA_START=200 /DNA_END=584 /DNA_ORIENTATION=-